MATGKYPRQPFADEGLPQDWGEPEEMPEVNDYLGPAPWAFGNWRFVVVELTADERVPDRAVEAIMGHVFLPAVKRCASVC